MVMMCKVLIQKIPKSAVAGTSCSMRLTAGNVLDEGHEQKQGGESPCSHATPRKPPRGATSARKQLAFGAGKAGGSAVALLEGEAWMDGAW